MFRIFVYLTAYIISLILAIVFNNQNWLESLIFMLFLISTITYTFSREGLPDKDIQHYPEAFEYKEKRVNIYGYGMIFLLIVASMIYYINNINQIINSTLLILILWPAIILGSYFLAKIYTEREKIYPIYDYVNYKLKTKLDIDFFMWVLANQNSKKLSIPGTFAKYNTQILRETQNLIAEYNQHSKTVISSEEINAARETRKF